MKKSKSRTLIIVLCAVAIVLIIAVGTFLRCFFSINEEAMISIYISMFEALGILISLIVAARQLKDSKDIARASFITELNESFTSSQDNMALYTALQECYDKKCPHQITCDDTCDCKLDFSKAIVSNYLTFFETIYVLEKNGVIDFELLDDLFAYRFFLAVHSKFVQQSKLASQPENFRNIFCLEYEWMQYRKTVAKKVDSPTSVFASNPLRNLMVTDSQKEIYKEWIGECRKF